jgi:hypothetical protein
MAERTRIFGVRNPADAQEVPAFPIEHFCDLRTGQRLRRECLGQVYGGDLIIGNFARSTDIDLLPPLDGQPA